MTRSCSYAQNRPRPSGARYSLSRVAVVRPERSTGSGTLGRCSAAIRVGSCPASRGAERSSGCTELLDRPPVARRLERVLEGAYTPECWPVGRVEGARLFVFLGRRMRGSGEVDDPLVEAPHDLAGSAGRANARLRRGLPAVRPGSHAGHDVGCGPGKGQPGGLDRHEPVHQSRRVVDDPLSEAVRGGLEGSAGHAGAFFVRRCAPAGSADGYLDLSRRSYLGTGMLRTSANCFRRCLETIRALTAARVTSAGPKRSAPAPE